MIKKTLIIIIFLISNLVFSQITNEGTPLSWKNNLETNSFQTNQLPKFNLKKLQQQDAINDILPRPYRFGYKHMVDYGFTNGTWTTLENGDRIWRIKFQSKNALSLNFIFNEFYLPIGSTLYLYNNDKSDLLGAYTAANNNANNSLGTWIIKGDTIWIEYFEPKNVVNQGRLHINSITHAYRGVKSDKELKNLGESGDCNQDVDCPIGDDWEDHKNHNKKSVAFILSNGADWCSGALINNTAENQQPYFLTANHCIDGENTANWVFRFGWISPNPVCATTDNSTEGPINMQINGAVVKANNSNSDFALLELNSDIPASWDRTWAGWDRTDTTPEFVVGIHHPAGDIMKICRDNAGTVPVVANDGVYEWEITTSGGGWELGVTEGGSSGSPLFDQDAKIIGQLFRGSAACNGVNDNGLSDQYGRFAISWDGISGNSNQLQPWLDPNNSEITVLESYPSMQTLAIDAMVSVSIPEIDCGETQVTPLVTIKNKGTTTLTNATIQWDLDSGENTTINWTGNLTQNESENIDLGIMNLSMGNHVINTTVTDPNDTVDENTNNNTASTEIDIDIYVTTQIKLDLFTDDYCEENEWSFKDANGTILYSGGPYTQNVEDLTHFYETFDVPTNQCYTFEITDSQGDGICCSYGNGSYTLSTQNDTVIYRGGSFGFSEITSIAIDNMLGINNLSSNNIAIYPNPVTNSLNVNLNNISGGFKYIITNILGQTIQQDDLSNSRNVLDVSNIKKGIYFLKINDVLSENKMVKKIIIK